MEGEHNSDMLRRPANLLRKGDSWISDRWHVREFSTGELVSLLFILPKRVAWVLPNPPLGRPRAEDALSHLTRQDSFIELLIAN
jgi:hypothetical protein